MVFLKNLINKIKFFNMLSITFAMCNKSTIILNNASGETILMSFILII
jgi:hypothetical protein